MNGTELGWLEVGTSVLLVAVAVLVAAHQRLGLSKDVLLAAVRAFVQLVAVGMVLVVIFEHGGALGALGWVVLMVVIAGQVAGRRGKGVPRAKIIATVSVASGAGVALAVLLLLDVFPGRPSVIVPIGGMIVANSMQAVGLVLLRLAEHVDDSRAEIEARLSLGMDSAEAFGPHRRSAARAALLPAIDATKVVGLISLPGAMTGLILAGVDPLTAIRYQIVVMYMILGAAALAAAVAVHLGQRRLFDQAQRLRV
ncbi:putative ABC transport system permease protein [Haloechinothrix alba]|uniref:Putative ABC transport system permease protein n=1 Tax=Haloechinothrix alba TaxID=664784 RepID=A0A238YCZ2_9PSEU|nr:iron export ABC transporter permease subunit FetB [Haloechinothrix alba]SNR68940.1 putative ABC transport system permease protein [Haloechinothrix alba]